MTNVLSVMLAAILGYWLTSSARLKLHPRSRMLIASLTLLKMALWLWSFVLVIQLIAYNINPTAGTFAGRVAILIALIFEMIVITKIYPAPCVDGF